jgi:hypothetical protein
MVAFLESIVGVVHAMFYLYRFTTEGAVAFLNRLFSTRRPVHAAPAGHETSEDGPWVSKYESCIQPFDSIERCRSSSYL